MAETARSTITESHSPWNTKGATTHPLMPQRRINPYVKGQRLQKMFQERMYVRPDQVSFAAP